MSGLPSYYPIAQLPLATLLEWAHLSEPPYDQTRDAAPWLKGDNEVRSYLTGVLHGHLSLWRHAAFREAKE